MSKSPDLRDKSLESAPVRIVDRIAHDLGSDVFDLCATCTAAIARGHRFNAGNKRTACRAMPVCLAINWIGVAWSILDVRNIIVRVAKGPMDEGDLADRPRTHPRKG